MNYVQHYDPLVVFVSCASAFLVHGLCFTSTTTTKVNSTMGMLREVSFTVVQIMALAFLD